MSTTGDTVSLRAFAKVNLTLEVLGKRPDGYHELCSLVQCISLADELTLRATGGGITVRVRSDAAPEDAQNICYQAAESFIQQVGSPTGVDIRLTKHIPVGRGLGGGSSDAAATLRGLAELAEHPPAEDVLREIAAQLGSDVPLFLGGGTVVISGRGEIVEAVTPQWRDTAFVIAWPEIGVSTAHAYTLLSAEDFTDGEITASAQRALAAGQLDPDRHLFNCFQRAVFARWPEIARLQRQLCTESGHYAHLSGSGSAVFSLCPDRATAAQAAARVRQAGYQAVAAESASGGAAVLQS